MLFSALVTAEREREREGERVKMQSSDREYRTCALIKLFQSKMEAIVDHGGERGGKTPRGVEEMKETFI
jgi:hypothetical protein